jgi:hypothetical protein
VTIAKDDTSPTASVTDPAADKAQTASTYTVGFTKNDADSGVASWYLDRQQGEANGSGGCTNWGVSGNADWTVVDSDTDGDTNGAETSTSGDGAPAADTALVTGKCYRWRVRSTDNVTNTTTTSSTSNWVMVDTSAPSIALSSPWYTEITGPQYIYNTGSDTTVWYNTAAAPSAFKYRIGADATDAQSGVNRVEFQDYGSANWTFTPAAAGGVVTDSTSAYTYEVENAIAGPADPTARDIVSYNNTTGGGTASSPLDNNLYDPQGDATNPTVGATTTITESGGGSAYEYVNGTTIYYNPAHADNFDIATTNTDGGSGPRGVDFPSFGAGWTGGGSEDTSAPYSENYSYTTTPTPPGAKTLTGYDNVARSNTTSVTISKDDSAPTASFTAPGPSTEYQSGTSYNVQFTKDDADSGVATWSLDRQDGTPNGTGGCNWTGSWATQTSDLNGDTNGAESDNELGLADLTCYRWRVVVVDNVTNATTTVTSSGIIIDTTPPSIALSSPWYSELGGNQYIYNNGVSTTVWYSPTANAGAFSFRITADSADADSGINHVEFQDYGSADWTFTPAAVGGVVTDSTSAYSYDVTNAVQNPADPSARDIVSYNNVGSPSAPADNNLYDVSADGNVPTPSITAPAATVWRNATSAYNATWTESDADSGIDSAATIFERQVGDLSAGSCSNWGNGVGGNEDWTQKGATGITSPYGDNGQATAHCYRYRVTAVDNVSNSATTSSTGNEVRIDTSDPTAVTFASFSEGTNPEYMWSNSNVMYYNAAQTGDFTVRLTATDAESGIKNIIFPSFGGGWTGGGNTDTTSTFDSSAYVFTSGDTAPSWQAATATNNTDLTYTPANQFRVLAEPDDPTDSISDPAADIYQQDPTYDVQFTKADATSGVASWTVERQTGTASNGTCGTWGSGGNADWTAVDADTDGDTDGDETVTLGDAAPASDTAFVSGKCYRFRIVTVDNTGRSTTTAASNWVMRDTSAPTLTFNSFSELTGTASTYIDSTTMWYNPATPNPFGSFRVTLDLSDDESGDDKVDFPALGANWTPVGVSTDSSSAYSVDYVWGALNPANPSPLDPVGYNNAGVTTTATDLYDVEPDGTNPTQSFTAPATDEFQSLTSYDVQFTKADADSGVASWVLERQQGSPTGAGACNDWGTNGNTDWTTDASDLDGDTDGAESSNNVGLTDLKCYRWRITTTDNVGNSVQTTSNFVIIDSTPPVVAFNAWNELTNTSKTFIDGSTLWYNSTFAAGASFRLTVDVTDPQSGAWKAVFPDLGTNWTPAAAAPALTDSSSPFTVDYAWTNTGMTDPGAIDVDGYNNIGTSATGTGVATITGDGTNPTASITAPAATVWKTTTAAYSATWTSADTGGSGVDESRTVLERQTGDLAAGSCTNWGANGNESWTAKGSAGDPSPYVDNDMVTAHCYRYRVTVYDNVDNTLTTSSTGNEVRVDTTDPTAVTFVSFTEGTNAGNMWSTGSTMYYNAAAAGDFSVQLSVTDAQSADDAVDFPTFGGGWTGGGNTDSTSTYDSTSYAFTSGDTEPSWLGATGYNNAGGSLAATNVFRVLAEPDDPTGLLSFTTGFVADTAISLVHSHADATSDVFSWTLQYDETNLDNGDGTCDAFPGSWTPTGGANPSSPTGFTATSGKCYKFRQVIVDNVSRSATIFDTNDIVKVDTTDPTVAVTGWTESTATTYQNGGTTLWYNPAPATGGPATLTATVTDAQSGPDKVDFPALGANWTPGTTSTDSSSPFTNDYAWTATPPAVVGAKNVTGYNKAGGATTAGFTVTADSTDPTGSVDYPDGYQTNTDVDVDWMSGDVGGSGVRITEIQRQTGDLSGGLCVDYGINGNQDWTTVATDPLLGTINDTPLVNNKCYKYRTHVEDNVDNQHNYTSTNEVKVDTSTPTVTFNAFTENTNTSKIYADNANALLWYNPSFAAGSSFTLAVDVAAASGAQKAVFPALGTGWTPAAAAPALTDSTGGSPYTVDYIWSGTNPQDPGAIDVTGYSNTNASTTANGIATISPDGTNPSVSISYTNNSIAVTNTDVTWSASDADSDIQAGTVTIERRTGTLANGSCDYTGVNLVENWTVKVTDPLGSPWNDATLATGLCYQYRVNAKDNVDNSNSANSGNEVKVDTTAPTAVTFNSFTEGSLPSKLFADGSTMYYNPAALGTPSFDVTVDVVDAQSGPWKAVLPQIGVGWSPGTATTDSGAPFKATYSYSAANPAVPGAQDVTGYNNAGGSTVGDDIFTVTADGTPPSGTIGSPDGHQTATTADVEFLISDAGSDLRTWVIKRDETTMDNGDGSCDAFPGTYATTVETDPLSTPVQDSGLQSGKCYKYRLYAEDNVDNTYTLDGTDVTKVDTSGPSVTFTSWTESTVYTYASTDTLFYNPDQASGGPATLTLGLTDTQSGPQKIVFPALGADWTPAAAAPALTDSSSPFTVDYAWTSATPADPGAQTPVGYNNAGGTTNATNLFTVTPDSTAPTGTIDYSDGYETTTSTDVDWGVDDGTGSGVRTFKIERQTGTLSGGACSDYGVAGNQDWTTVETDPLINPITDSGLADQHCYKYRLIGTDNVNNDNSAAPVTVAKEVKVDTNPPVVTFNSWQELTSTTSTHPDDTVDELIWYNPNVASGSFRLNVDVTAPSGPQKAVFEAPGANWTPPAADAALTDSAGGNPYSVDYAWTSATPAVPGGLDVVGYSNTGVFTTASDLVTISADGTDPVLTVSNTDDYQTTDDIDIDWTAADAGAGVRTFEIKRDSAPLTNGGCGLYTGSWTSIAVDPATSPVQDSDVTDGRCYKYEIIGEDNVDNTVTVLGTDVTMVDTTDPTVTFNAWSEITNGDKMNVDSVDNTKLWYNPSASGTARLAIDVVDAQSGPKKVTFPALGANWTPALATDDSTGGSPYTMDYAWTATPAIPGTKSAVGYSNTDAFGSANFTVAEDGNNPTGSVDYAPGYVAALSVDVDWSAADADSGLRVVKVQRDVADLTNNGCGSYSGTWTDVEVDPGSSPITDSGLADGKCYIYRTYVEDNVDHIVTFTDGTDVVKTDTTDPTVTSLTYTEGTNPDNMFADGTTMYYRSTLTGSFTMTVATSDGESGIQDVLLPALGSGWLPGTDTTDGTSAYSVDYSWSGGAAEPGADNAVVTNNKGTTVNAAFTILQDDTAPTGNVNYPDVASSTPNVDVAFDYTDALSGVAAGDGTWWIERRVGTFSGGACDYTGPELLEDWAQ